MFIDLVMTLSRERLAGFQIPVKFTVAYIAENKEYWNHTQWLPHCTVVYWTREVTIFYGNLLKFDVSFRNY